MIKITNIIQILTVLFTFCCALEAQAHLTKVYAFQPSFPTHSSVLEQNLTIYEYDDVDILPQFPGGERGLMNYIQGIKEYPYSAFQQRIQGRVVCSFVIEPSGQITHISIVKGIDESLDNEAIRIIKNMPKWKAAKINEENVYVRCILPIAFRL